MGRRLGVIRPMVRAWMKRIFRRHYTQKADPYVMTARKAKARAEADPQRGMTERKAKATAKAD